MGFIIRSLFVLFVLYGLVFAIGDVLLLHGGFSIWWGIAFAVAIIGMQYLIAPWLIETFFTIYWDDYSVPPALQAYVDRLCRERGMPSIRLGLIESGSPNAFAFGRLRSDARIVVTRGLVDILSQDELESVLAHELGHVAHYDFAVMAAAALAPLLLYQIYIWSNRINNLRIVSYAAYLAYWMSRLLVLLLNRTREFGADHFSSQVTGQPCQLSSALVKISYGMVRERSEAYRLIQEGKASAKKESRRSLQFGHSLSLMGIASAATGSALALARTPEEVARVMKWDLVNPWARFYQLGSTHPLTAMRLRALNRESEGLGQAVRYPLPPEARVRWSGFPIEFVFWLAPLACGFLLFSEVWLQRSLEKIGIMLPHHFMPWALIVLGITWASRIAFRYEGAFKQSQISELLEDLNVSQMRPRAVELKGEIVGHGVPGAFWSPDLLMKDESGMMFLLYRSSVPLGRLFFAMRSADRFIGERVTVKGWYRRGIRPYVEMASVEALVSKGSTAKGLHTLFGSSPAEAPLQYEVLVERSYSRWIQLAVAAICAGVGIILMMNA